MLKKRANSTEASASTSALVDRLPIARRHVAPPATVVRHIRGAQLRLGQFFRALSLAFLASKLLVLSLALISQLVTLGSAENPQAVDFRRMAAVAQPIYRTRLNARHTIATNGAQFSSAGSLESLGNAGVGTFGSSGPLESGLSASLGPEMPDHLGSGTARSSGPTGPATGADWFRDSAPPLSSVIDALEARANAALEKVRTLAARTYNAQPVGGGEQNPYQSSDLSRPTPPPRSAQQTGPNSLEPYVNVPGQFSNWPPQAPQPNFVSRANFNHDQIPSFGYSNGPSGPSAPTGPFGGSHSFQQAPQTPPVSYYNPYNNNNGNDNNDYGTTKKPPVLLIGNFPPFQGSSNGGSGASLQSHTFPYIPPHRQLESFGQNYGSQGPQGPQSQQRIAQSSYGANPPAITPDQYGSPPTPFNPYENNPQRSNVPSPHRALPLPSPPQPSEEEYGLPPPPNPYTSPPGPGQEEVPPSGKVPPPSEEIPPLGEVSPPSGATPPGTPPPGEVPTPGGPPVGDIPPLREIPSQPERVPPSPGGFTPPGFPSPGGVSPPEAPPSHKVPPFGGAPLPRTPPSNLVPPPSKIPPPEAPPLESRGVPPPEASPPGPEGIPPPETPPLSPGGVPPSGAPPPGGIPPLRQEVPSSKGFPLPKASPPSGPLPGAPPPGGFPQIPPSATPPSHGSPPPEEIPPAGRFPLLPKAPQPAAPQVITPPGVRVPPSQGVPPPMAPQPEAPPSGKFPPPGVPPQGVSPPEAFPPPGVPPHGETFSMIPPRFPTLIPPPPGTSTPPLPRKEFPNRFSLPPKPSPPSQFQPSRPPPGAPRPSPGPPQTFEIPPGPFQPTPPPEQIVPNKIRGKARVICEESGMQFAINTIFPFTGQIFAHDRKRVPSCVYNFREALTVNVSFSYAECGIRNAGNETNSQEQYHLQIIVQFEQPVEHSTSVQSFIMQCAERRLQYNKQTIPKRIEEALEELRLVPTQLEQKAPVPDCELRIVTDVEHHKPGDGVDIDEVDVGQSLRVEFSLKPESDAYGFLVRNCIVRDTISGMQHEVIDSRGCSTDLNIFAHPHYDTYHDVARVHWHAFKLPDHTRLSFTCQYDICLEIADENGVKSCATIPTPPFCADIVTSPSNSILFDAQNSDFARSKRENTVTVEFNTTNGTKTRMIGGTVSNAEHILSKKNSNKMDRKVVKIPEGELEPINELPYIFAGNYQHTHASPYANTSTDYGTLTQSVHAGICLDANSKEYCNSTRFEDDRKKHLEKLAERTVAEYDSADAVARGDGACESSRVAQLVTAAAPAGAALFAFAALLNVGVRLRKRYL